VSHRPVGLVVFEIEYYYTRAAVHFNRQIGPLDSVERVNDVRFCIERTEKMRSAHTIRQTIRICVNANKRSLIS